MKPQLRVLIVDDSADDSELLVLELTRGGYQVNSLRVDRADALQQALADGGWQVVLCDFSLPGFSGSAALRMVKASGLDVPFIFVSGTMGEELAVGAMKAGADDYVMKDRLARLVPAVTREVRESEDRRRAEQGLRKQTRMNQALFNQAITSFVLFDRDHRIIQVNESYASYYGKTPDDFVGRSIVDIPSADQSQDVANTIIDEVVRTKAPVRFTSWPHRFADRPERRITYWDSILQPILDEHGEVEFLFFSAIDVTERRRAEEALRANAARLLQQEAALIALTRRKEASEDDVLTSLRRITEVSSRTLGVARVSVWRYNADRTAMRCVDLHELAADRHSSGIELEVVDLPRYLQALAQDDAIAADDVTEEPRFAELVESYLRPLGITSMMDASVLSDGALAGVVCFEHVGPPRQWTLDERTFAVATANVVALVLEEWERKEAEEALRASEQRFRQVTENIDEVFWLTDVEKHEMIYISPAYSRVWGRTCESLKADPRSWIDAIHPEDRERVREAALTAQTTGAYDLEYRIVRPDGTERWVHDRAFPIRDAEHRVYRIAGVAEDMTRRRQLEDQLRQSQKMDAIGQLAGGVAHDFNNLLAVIQMASSVLLTRPSTAAEMQEGLQQILAVSEQAANLTRQLLTFSRRSVRQARDIDLAEVTGGMTKLLRRILGEDLTLETRIAHSLPLVNADPGMMEQVLMNLAVNARDAMPEGGRLHISLDVLDISADDVGQRPRAVPGRFVRLLVQDTGCGIQPQDIPRIFEPFFTTKDAAKGTGLGLATVFGIVEQHHGWIDVTSEVGRGTTFEVFLPALTTSRAAARNETTTLKFPRGTESILLVEDDPAVRRLARVSLEHCGYRVHEAESPGVALALWETLPESVDLLFTDLIMPGGMTGRELAERLVERQPGLKVIYSSGYSYEVVRPELRLTPGFNFLQKPYHLAEMAATVRRCLDER
jgi:PAS domain S-box-containing protein